jgi:hypothetical protein
VNLGDAALQWTYVVRSRQRWTATEASTKQQAEAAADLLQRFGVDRDALSELARASMVEVSIRWLGSEENDWPARILPWEYVIAAATRNQRSDRPITVMRHLSAIEATSQASRQKLIKRVLFVASEPGPLFGHYNYDAEREIVRTHLQVDKVNWRELNSPTGGELSAAVSAFRPDLVHLTGFDTHEARVMLGSSIGRYVFSESAPSGEGGVEQRQDGYVLAGPEGLHFVRSEELGQLLSPHNHRPRLVALNIRNSAARVAPLAVVAGARAAIGFQDNFDDELAELFYTILYSRLSRSGWDLASAFRSAWERVRDQPGNRQGTGVVLWSATPLLTPTPGQLSARPTDTTVSLPSN